MSEIPWFKVDDKLHDHRKARAAGTTAMGLWVLAGSWAADNTTDGFVPDSICQRWDRAYKRLAATLVAVGFWSVACQDGEDGWRFHEWDQRQPTKKDIEKKRAEARTRMAELRANGSRGVRANSIDGSPEVLEPVPSRPNQGATQEGGDAHPTFDDGRRSWPTHCLDHRFVENPGPCGGCKVSRETIERQETQSASYRAAARVAECRRCDPDGWVLDEAGEATSRRCKHLGVAS